MNAGPRGAGSRALVVPATLAAVVGVLVLAGRGHLATPPLDDLSGWLESTDTITATIAVMRLVALVIAVWLLVTTLAAAVARLLGHARLVAAADRTLPVPVRRLLTGLAGAGAASIVVLGGAGGQGGNDGAVPVGDRLVLLPAEGEGTATMSVLPAEPDAVAAPAAPVPAPPTAPTTWTVEPGDSFWSIAEDVLGDAWGRPPTDAEIDPYWRSLIAANRDRISSGNPDLIFPGQEFVLPPVG